VLERYDGERWSELAAGHFRDLDGAGDVVWIAGDQLQRYEAGTLSVIATPAELGPLSFTAVHVVAADSIWILALRAADGSSLLFHHAAGTLSLELTQFPDGHDPIALEDIAGTSDTDLWLLATRRPFSKTPSSALLRREGHGFSTFDLAAHGFERLLSDGEQLWLSGSLGVQAVALDALTAQSAATPAQVTPLTAGGQYPLSRGKPWLGPTDFWLTTPEQAMRMPR
jgi:hypothetical protein